MLNLVERPPAPDAHVAHERWNRRLNLTYERTMDAYIGPLPDDSIEQRLFRLGCIGTLTVTYSFRQNARHFDAERAGRDILRPVSSHA